MMAREGTSAPPDGSYGLHHDYEPLPDRTEDRYQDLLVSPSPHFGFQFQSPAVSNKRQVISHLVSPSPHFGLQASSSSPANSVISHSADAEAYRERGIAKYSRLRDLTLKKRQYAKRRCGSMAGVLCCLVAGIILTVVLVLMHACHALGEHKTVSITFPEVREDIKVDVSVDQGSITVTPRPNGSTVDMTIFLRTRASTDLKKIDLNVVNSSSACGAHIVSHVSGISNDFHCWEANVGLSVASNAHSLSLTTGRDIVFNPNPNPTTMLTYKNVLLETSEGHMQLNAPFCVDGKLSITSAGDVYTNHVSCGNVTESLTFVLTRKGSVRVSLLSMSAEGTYPTHIDVSTDLGDVQLTLNRFRGTYRVAGPSTINVNVEKKGGINSHQRQGVIGDGKGQHNLVISTNGGSVALNFL